MLGADLVFSMPVVSEFARKSGATVACNADAERLLERGALNEAEEENGGTPLRDAASRRHMSTVALILAMRPHAGCGGRL